VGALQDSFLLVEKRRMKKPGSRARARWWTALLGVALVLGPCPSFAFLGGGEASVEEEAAQLQAPRSVVEGDEYTVHELRAPTGTRIREYASRDRGTVFAVTWQGPFLPDLRQLLGPHFEAFSLAAQVQKARRVGHGPVQVRSGSLVVLSQGHMRAFFGRAYLEDAFPLHVRPEDLP